MRLIFFAAYLACVPLANWLIGHIGAVCVPSGPCLVPVWPGIMAPSGVLVIGAALVLRDLVQRTSGAWWGLLAVGVGCLLSWAVADPHIALASAAAFLFSELADFAIYTPMQRRGFVRAVALSSMAGLVVDSIMFLFLAFGSLDFLAGQIIGKLWAVLVALPLIHLSRVRIGSAS